MKKAEVLFGLLRLPVDALAVCAALLLSYRLRVLSIDLIPQVQLLEPPSTLPGTDAYLSSFVLPGILLFLVVAALLQLYALRTTRSAWNEIGRLLVASLLWLTVIIGWYFLVRRELFYSRILLLHATFFIALFTALGRASVTLLQRAFLRCGIGNRHVVSLGRRKPPREARDTLEQDVRYRYRGHVSNLRGLKRLEKDGGVDLVLQTDPNPTSKNTNALIEYCRSRHIGYAFLPPVLADNPHQLYTDHLGLMPLLRFQPTPLDGWGRVLKRTVDVLLSGILLILLFPVFLLCACAVLIGSGRPVLYVSRRIGEEGRHEIPVLKFRTMVPDADRKKSSLMRKSHRSDGPLFKLKDDPRVTRVGRVLRRWSLDELPQLFNVLAGHMSLVGPRPHLPEEVRRYSDYERRVFAVRPGITGLAQVSGRSDLPFREEVRLDLRYVEEWSPLLDCWILWRTAVTVFSREGAD